MTAIVSVLNNQGIAIAADSAATVNTGDIKKVYNKSNKLFALSEYHPVGIAVYNNLNFEGIPWETLIKVYRKQLKNKKFDFVEDYKKDFLFFLKKNLNLVTVEAKKNNFYTLCKEIMIELQSKFIKIVKDSEGELIEIVSKSISDSIIEYENTIRNLPQNDIIDFSFDEYYTNYSSILDEIIEYLKNEINEVMTKFDFSELDKSNMKNIFYESVKIKYIYEESTGLVFMGFGEKEVYPTSQLVTIGGSVLNTIRYNIEDPVTISPGDLNAEIIPYAQKDVTFSVLTGIDPNYEIEINKTITKSFETLVDLIQPSFNPNDENKEILEKVKNIPSEIIKQLGIHKYTYITKPLLDILNNMGKEDMAELAESLVSITSLKRKFTLNSSDESVGGPIDVAIITKGDGFIWIKRKNYFDINLNPRFLKKI